MDLREALGVLSKSSPYAVTTEGRITDPELRAIKDCLYVETEIELAFKAKLASIGSRDVVFLCGSSGDGKSEILTRYNESFGHAVDFHLDATHSFDPKDTAIDTLNKIFTSYKGGGRALVVGINIGMLANFEREGDEQHSDIKNAIAQFLTHGRVDPRFTFLDFEAFPKFELQGGRVSSLFFSSLLDRVVRDDQRNKFRGYFNQNVADRKDPVLIANFELLHDRWVQKAVIELLLNARIRQDQFVTARMLLDFIYCILTGPGYLFDNIFSGGDNELLQAMTTFDPSVIRNRDIDTFIMHRTLGLDEPGYRDFLRAVESKYRVTEKLEAISSIRLLFIIRSTRLEHLYATRFKAAFHDAGDLLYRDVWELHKVYSGDAEEKKRLRGFYDDVVFASISGYANRNAPYLSKDEFYLSSHGHSDMASEVELSVRYKAIEADQGHDIHAFNLYLSVNGEELDPVSVNVNLLSLMLDVVSGYRPNKYDKNSVVLLDELVANITAQVGNADTLYLYNGGKRVKIKENRDGDIRVSGL